MFAINCSYERGLMKFTFLLAALVSLPSFALTLGTYNIRNFDYDERSRVHTNKSELANILVSLKADVLSVEEINDGKEFGRFLSSRLPGYDVELTRCGGEHDQTLGFIYNTRTIELLNFEESLATSNPGQSGTCNSGSRPLAIGIFKVKSTGQKFIGVTAHLKSGGQANSMSKRAQQYQIIRDIVRSVQTRTGIRDFYIAGDFNSTSYEFKGPDYTNLRQVVSQMGGTDLAATLSCTAYWWGGSDDKIETPSLLDHLIVSPGLLKSGSVRAQVHAHCQKVNCREVPIRELGESYGAVSDHCPITATVQ